MKEQLHVLMVEDSEDDAVLLTRELQHGGFEVQSERVETADSFVSALGSKEWDVILCDYKMPKFNGMKALEIVKERGIDVPFIFVSGRMGEETAVEAMHAGAHDYVMKNSLKRLIPAIERELHEAKIRKEGLRAEKALYESEERMRSIVEGTPHLFFYTQDAQANTTYVSPTVEQITGYTVDQWLMRKDWFVTDAKNNQSAKEKTYAHLQGRFTDEPTIIEIRHANGDPILLEAYEYPIIQNGKVISLQGVAHDITERKRGEDAVRESEERFRMVFENVFDGISIYSEDPDPSKRRLVECNNRYATMAGRTREELLKLGSTLGFQITLEDTANENRLKSLAQGAAYRGSFSWIRPDGKDNVIEYAGVPIIWRGRLHSISIDHDITERKRAEDEIKTILRTTIDGYYLVDTEGRFLDTNDSYCSIIGYSREELLTMSIKDIEAVDTEEVIKRRIQKIMETGSDRFETKHKCKDGRIIDIEASVNSFKGKEGKLVVFMRDITERKQKEEAFRESELRFRSLIEEAPVAITISRDGIIMAGNRKGAEVYGLRNAQDVVGRSVLDYFAPQSREESKERTRRRSLGLPAPSEFESVGLRADGSQFPVHVAVASVELSGGKANIAFITDITDRKRAEESLMYERNLLKALMNNAPDHLYFKDKESRFLTISRTLARYFGLDDPAQAVGRTDFDFFAEEHARQAFEDEQEIVKSGIPIVDLEEKESWPDGRQTWVSTTKVPFRDAEGKTVGTFGISRDITKRKQAEEERLRLVTAIEQIAEAILVTDPRGVIQYVNPAFELITGFIRKEVIGQNPRIMKSGRQNVEFYEKLWKTISMGGKWKGRFINKKKDGTLFTDETTISPVFDERGEIINYVGVKRDITSELSLQTQLAQAQKLEGIGTLASGIAHDFNNILGIIVGHTSLLERLREDSKMYSESVAAIMSATQRGTMLVKQIMLFARKTEPLLESVKINNIIGEITKLLRETFPKTITISTTLQQDLPSIVADSSQIHQVLLNLLVNARDAMPKGGTISITTTAIEGETVSSRFANATAPQYVKVEVADTGIGMDESTRERIFEPFFTTKGPGKGTGLGLAVVFGIVEHHNGFVDVRSALAEGTSFAFYLPIPEHAREEVPAAKKRLEEIPGGTETILVIEDEEALRTLAKGILVAKGYTVLTAGDGMQGVELYRSHQKEIAVVLSDIGLPILGGHDVFRKIRAINPVAKIIFASGFFDPETKSEMFKAGLKNFIQKPYMQDEVLQKIRTAIDTQQ